MPKTRLLVVEDNEKTAELLRIYLESGGFAVTVAGDAAQARADFGLVEPELVLLDVLLPGGSGFELCREFRAQRDVPVILLTARASERDKLHGLGLGADDYVTKPFSPREVVARVKTVLRRTARRDRGEEPEAPRRGDAAVSLDGLVVDLAERRASAAGVALDLPPTELRVLDVLVRAAGRLLSREDLARRAFGPGWDGAPRAIDAYVARLRRKLANANAGAPRITTVFGGGYRLERAARSPR